MSSSQGKDTTPDDNQTPFTQKKDTKQMSTNTVAFDLRRIHLGVISVAGIICYYCGVFGLSLLPPIIVLLFALKYLYRTALRAKPFQVPDVGKDTPQFMNYESTRWLCLIIKNIWTLLDPNVIQSLIDTVEDSLQENLPSFLNSIGVVDFHLGTNAPTIANVFANKSNQDDSMFLEFDIAVPSMHIGQTQTSSNPKVVLEMVIAKKILPQLTARIVIDNITLRGRLMMHIEFTGEAPFMQTAYIAFQRPPQIDFSIKPMGALDLMTLPGLSEFVMSSINSAIGDMMVVPNWFKLDLSKMLTGDDTVNSMYQSLMVVHFQRLVLTGQGTGKLNPYLTIAPETGERILARTRSFKQREEINSFETILIPKTDMSLNKRMRIGLWAEDRFTSDQLHAWSMLPVKDLSQKTGLVYDGGLELTDNTSVKGRLQCKISMHSPLPHFEARFDSAIMQVQVFQAKDLTVPASFLNLTRDYLNPYATIKLNGSELYRTRTKLHNSHPFWNATHEGLVRDWREAQLLIQVYDQRDYEFDVCIGDVVLNLNEMEKTFTQNHGLFRGWRDLIGTGAGKIRINIKLISLDIKIPRCLRGFDRGTLTIFSAFCEDWKPPHEGHHPSQYRIRFSVLGFDPQHPDYKSESVRCHGSAPLFWNDLNMEIPLTERLHTTIRVYIEPAHKLLHRSDTTATSFDLQLLVDNELMMVRLPIYGDRPPQATVLEADGHNHNHGHGYGADPNHADQAAYSPAAEQYASRPSSSIAQVKQEHDLAKPQNQEHHAEPIIEHPNEDGSDVEGDNSFKDPYTQPKAMFASTSSTALDRYNYGSVGAPLGREGNGTSSSVNPLGQAHGPYTSGHLHHTSSSTGAHRGNEPSIILKVLFEPEVITSEDQQEREQLAFSKANKRSPIRQIKAVRVAKFATSKAKDTVRKTVLDKRFIKRTSAQNVPKAQQEGN
ncbi:hypothetical protein RI367_003634 [Sorochytrium milnesiophthora]